MSEETIFEKILKGDIPCEEVYSDEICLAFKDILPQAPIHILIIPRKHIKGLNEISIVDKSMLGHLLLTSTKIAEMLNLKDWRIIINNGEKAGQTVFHLHVHLIAGRELKWPPG